ncbi:MAG: helix-turn-helix domain-containing protein [Actinomycetota bacterium]|nr:helix-turn-helix domain-containing protein [Actinomycetota bacterium]
MADIGARLREARMRAKIDINEVEMRTKIRAKYLRAIENEEWDLLPGEVYVKSFLRTYGGYLGLDTRQLIDDFRQQYERPSDHEMRPIAPPGRDRDRVSRGRVLPPWLIIGAVLIIVVVVLFAVGKLTGGSNPPPATHPAATPPAHRTHRRHRAGPPRTVAARTVRLQLVATGPVNVCLVNGTGRKLIPGLTYASGQPIPVKTAPKLLLTLGNNAVTMKVNGKTIAVPASAGAIGYELLPGSVKVLPAAKQPTCA